MSRQRILESNYFDSELVEEKADDWERAKNIPHCLTIREILDLLEQYDDERGKWPEDKYQGLDVGLFIIEYAKDLKE